MPPNEKGAGVLPAPTATYETYHQTAIVDEDDEARRFSELQDRAGRAGLTLISGATGYVLIRPGVASWHSGDLRTIWRLLVARGVA